jgi:hypothetical protein
MLFKTTLTISALCLQPFADQYAPRRNLYLF